MNLKERLNNQNQKNIKEKKDFEPGDVEIYMERSKQSGPLNKNKSVFESSFSKGINTDESVFNKYSIFKQ